VDLLRGELISASGKDQAQMTFDTASAQLQAVQAQERAAQAPLRSALAPQAAAGSPGKAGQAAGVSALAALRVGPGGEKCIVRAWGAGHAEGSGPW